MALQGAAGVVVWASGCEAPHPELFILATPEVAVDQEGRT